MEKPVHVTFDNYFLSFPGVLVHVLEHVAWLSLPSCMLSSRAPLAQDHAMHAEEDHVSHDIPACCSDLDQDSHWKARFGVKPSAYMSCSGSNVLHLRLQYL